MAHTEERSREMKLGIVVNVMDSDEAGATTYRLAADAINLGHEVWVMSTGSLAYNPDDTIGAFARTVPPGTLHSARFLDVFKSDKAINNGSRSTTWTCCCCAATRRCSAPGRSRRASISGGWRCGTA